METYYFKFELQLKQVSRMVENSAQASAPNTKKRTYREAMLPQELANRFRSKADFIKYFKECCKYIY